MLWRQKRSAPYPVSHEDWRQLGIEMRQLDREIGTQKVAVGLVVLAILAVCAFSRGGDDLGGRVVALVEALFVGFYWVFGGVLEVWRGLKRDEELSQAWAVIKAGWPKCLRLDL